MTVDPFNLDRFVQAQAKDYARALSELRAGRKTTHWMWYVLPQLRGLAAEPGNEVLREALRRYYAGVEDERTIALLRTK